MFRKLYQSYKQLPVAVKAAFWFVICNTLQKGIAFITVPIFTRIMPVEEYGLYSTYLSWSSVITILCSLNIARYIYINIIVKAKSEQEKINNTIPVFTLSLAITTVMFVLFLCIHNFFDSVFVLPASMMYMIFIYAIFQVPINCWAIKQQYEYKYIPWVIRTMIMVISNAVLGIVFVLLADSHKALARVISITIVEILFGCVFYIYFIRKSKNPPLFKGWKHILKVQLPLLPHELSSVILSSSDRIMISNIVGVAEAGIYSVAYSSGYVMQLLKNSVMDALKPWIYINIDKKNFDEIKKVTNPIMLMLVIFIFILISFAPEVISIMAPARYYEAIYVIPPVAASLYFMALYNLFFCISMYFEKTNKVMIVSVSAAVLNILLNLYFIPRFGYIAAGYTTMFCYIFFCFAHYLIMKRICHNELGGVKIFDIKFILLLSMVVIAVTVIFSLIYENWKIRYILTALLLVFTLIKSKSIVSSIREIKQRK